MNFSGYYMIIQIAISACAAMMAILVMYQQMKWTTKEKIPRWILALTGLQKSNSIKDEEVNGIFRPIQVVSYSIESSQINSEYFYFYCNCMLQYS